MHFLFVPPKHQRRAMILDAGLTARSWQRIRRISITKIFHRIQWFHIPISLGLVFIAFQQYRHIRKREILKNPSFYHASDIEIKMYKMLPLRTLSRWWGWINSIELPVFLRSPILRTYIKAFGCNIDEAFINDLKQYKNLGQFFRRALKPGIRPISQENGVVSPVDGTILHLGRAEHGMIEQVKGLTYSVRSFLGPQTWNSDYDKALACQEYNEYQKNLLMKNNNNDLYHCVIYLAPGDYHRFHSPAQWQIAFRRHFPGALLSVRPKFAHWFPGLFFVNERVIYTGEWQYGFFAMAAVGATNVGSIKVYFDEELNTNEKRPKINTFNDLKFVKVVQLNKGDDFGEFNLGSTVVLLFEGPKNMIFKIKPGDKVKMGQLIFN